MRRPRLGATLILVLLLAGTLRTAPLAALDAVNLSRYVVTAPAATVGLTQGVDAVRLTEYCGDEDGCQVIMQMVNYDADNEPGVAASRSGRLSISPTSPSHWRFDGEFLSPDGISGVSGTDGNGSQYPMEIWRVWDCVFSDEETMALPNISDAVGSSFSLINLSTVEGGTFPDATTECRVIFID